MRFLITGGCGFLGSNIAARLIADGENLMVFDNLQRAGATNNLNWLKSQGDFSFFHGDVRSQGDVENAIRTYSPDTVFHLAGQVAMTRSIERPRLDFEINALGTLNVLEAVRAAAPHAGVIYSSTNKVYGDLESLRYEEREDRYIAVDFPNGIPSTVTLDFHSPYGCSKGAADQYVLDYYRIYGVKGAVFRHSSMYGGRQFATIDQGWVGWFCRQALDQAAGSKTRFTVSGSGKQVRDLLHADDMVRLYLRAAARIDSIAGQAFNVGGGPANSLSILELLQFLQSEVGCTLNYQHIAPRESDQKVFVADLSRVTASVGWSPLVGWREGVRSMLEWVRTLGGDYD